MYIILNTADFSANNIGTLDQWSISCNRPKGITWSGLTSAVDKGANFSAVAEIDTANYELITMSVTMGATTQSGVGTNGGITISKSGSRYTITISSVTANVNISVTTKNLSTETPGSGGGSGEGGTPTPTTYTFTVNPTPTSATVTLSATGYTTVTGTGSKSITVASGTIVSWSVSASGYTSQNGTQNVTSTSSKSITLSASSSGGGTSGNTVNLYQGDRIIVSSVTDMIFTAKLALRKNGVMTDVKGRASDHTHTVAASAGQTVTLSQPISGVTLTYALCCFDSRGTLCSNENNFTATAWISDNVTLPTNTAYVMIAFKRGDGSSDFSSTELAQLPNALTIA